MQEITERESFLGFNLVDGILVPPMHIEGTDGSGFESCCLMAPRVRPDSDGRARGVISTTTAKTLFSTDTEERQQFFTFVAQINCVHGAHREPRCGSEATFLHRLTPSRRETSTCFLCERCRDMHPTIRLYHIRRLHTHTVQRVPSELSGLLSHRC